MTSVEKIVRKSLGSRVVAVETIPGVNRDGADVLRIRVTYDETMGPIDVDTLLSVTDRLCRADPELPGFPVVTFVAKGDVEPLLAAE